MWIDAKGSKRGDCRFEKSYYMAHAWVHILALKQSSGEPQMRGMTLQKNRQSNPIVYLLPWIHGNGIPRMAENFSADCSRWDPPINWSLPLKFDEYPEEEPVMEILDTYSLLDGGSIVGDFSVFESTNGSTHHQPQFNYVECYEEMDSIQCPNNDNCKH